MGLGLFMRSREDILLYLAVKSMGSMLNMTCSPDVGVDLWVGANDRSAMLSSFLHLSMVVKFTVWAQIRHAYSRPGLIICLYRKLIRAGLGPQVLPSAILNIHSFEKHALILF